MIKEDKALLKSLKEQVDKLSPFEKHFDNAKRNYLIMKPQTLGELLTARYGEDWRDKVSKQVTSCTSCKLKEVLKIGLEYDSMKKTIQQLEESAKKKKEEEQ